MNKNIPDLEAPILNKRFLMPREKKALRKYFLMLRKNMSDEDIHQLSCKIGALLTEELLHEPCAIHLFLPIVHMKEVDLSGILPILWDRGYTVYVPRVTNDILEHVQLTKEMRLIKNNWGIPEPPQKYEAVSKETLANIKCVLTPLLICDKAGNRVGYGGGFYDQFFKEFPNIQKIGVGFFEPIPKIEDVYEGDVPLDIYVSPEKITRFKR